MVHVDHHDEPRLVDAGFFQHVDKFVKAETVPDSREAVYFKIRADDEKVGAEQRRGAAGPDEDAGIEYEFRCGSRTVKDKEEENEEYLGIFEILPEDEGVPQGEPRRRVTQYGPYEVEAARVETIVPGYVKIEAHGYVEEKDCHMDAGDQDAAPHDEPRPPFVPVGEVIGKDKDAVVGMDLKDVEDGNDDDEKNTYPPARRPPQKEVGIVADQGNKGADQYSQEKTPLKAVGVVLAGIIDKDQNEKKAGTQ
jgi:hypothetical protein